MKKLLFILLSLFIFVACSNENKKSKEKEESTEQQSENINIKNSRAHRFFESRNDSNGENHSNTVVNETSEVDETADETVTDTIPETEPVETETQPVAETQPVPAAQSVPQSAVQPTTRPAQQTTQQTSSTASNNSGNRSGDSAGGGSSQHDRKEEARSYLRLGMAEANSQMSGKKVDHITTCDKIEFKNDNVYYYYIIDESQMSITELRGMKDTIKESIINTLNNTPGTEVLIEQLEILHGKIIYVYTGNRSEESFTISLQY